MFPVQLLENYRRREDNNNLMAIPNLEDPLDEWEAKEIRNKRKVKDKVHYLVK